MDVFSQSRIQVTGLTLTRVLLLPVNWKHRWKTTVHIAIPIIVVLIS